MRLLADENFPKPIVEVLRADGNDVLWARTDCSGWKDADLLDFAECDAGLVLTLDKDFWQFAGHRRIPIEQSGVVLLRVQPWTSGNIQPLARVFVETDRPWPLNIS